MTDEALVHGQRWSAATPLSTAQALDLLTDALLEVEGRLVEASNTTLYCALRPASRLAGVAEPRAHAIYKPVSGERPLQDFPDGTLARRERAAWLVSEAAGWSLVPPTVLRDGPLGGGMVQLWIETDPDADVLELILIRDARLRRMALFDVLTNNADRKGGHILVTLDGQLHGCDHGICFAVEPKLRTLLWGWADEPLLEEEHEALEQVRAGLSDELGEALTDLLDAAELDALGRRLEGLLSAARFPRPDRSRRIVPWPPF